MTAAAKKGRATTTARPAQSAARRRCAIYSRKSVARGLDKDFNSLVHQFEACKSYVRARANQGWELVDTEYSDGGYSGKDIERPGFQRLMADVEAGLIDVVLVYKVDRLSRSILDFAQVMRTFADFDCAFVSVTQDFSTANAMGRLTLNVLMSFAEFESDMISERTRDNIAMARLEGRWTGGPTPYGYRVDDGKLVLEPASAPIAKHVFTRYESLRSMCVVVQELNHADVLRPRMRGDDDASRPWDKNDIQRILTNPVYGGLIRSGDGLVPGRHEALVDRETFDRVQGIIACMRPRAPTGPRNPAYILKGLIRCGGCGAAMTSASSRSKGNTYRYYRCTTRDKRGHDACPVQQVPALPAEAAVAAELGRLAAEPPLFAAIVGFGGARLDDEVAALEAERAELPAQIDQLSAESDRRAPQREALSTEEQEYLAARHEELRAAKARVAEIDDRLELAAAARAETTWLRDVLVDFEHVWEALTLENRARTVRALVQKVTVDADGRAHIDLITRSAAVAT